MPHAGRLTDLNFNHLAYFHAVAHAGGVNQAAEELHISPSALSVQIRKLEQHLGHELFERRGRSLVLSDIGTLALEHADRIFSAGDELLAAVAGQSAIQTVRVGALSTLSRNFQLGLLKPLLGRDDVHLVLRAAGMRELIEQLDAHALDMVLTTRAFPRDGERTSHLLQEQPVSLIGPRRSGCRKRFRFPQDVVDRPLLVPGPENALRDAFDHVMSAADIVPHIRGEIDDMALMRLIARHSPDCLALVPPVVVRDELDSGELEEYCQIDELHARFYAITRSRQVPHPLIGEVIASASQTSPHHARRGHR